MRRRRRWARRPPTCWPGSDAAMAVLAALLRRERDGKGCDIDVSMVESMSRFMAPRLMPYLGSGELSAPIAADATA